MTKFLALFFGACLVLASCKKPAGEGGQASVRGKVIVQDYNGDFSVLKGTYPGYDVDVYIIYGDEPTYGDKLKTGPDGTFVFKYLRKGNYKVYVYSKIKVDGSEPESQAIFREATISKRKGEVTVDDITIID
jgi:hypothetical protein